MLSVYWSFIIDCNSTLKNFLCCKILHISNVGAVIEISCENFNCTKIREIISNKKCYQYVEVLSSTAILHSGIPLLQN